MSSAEDGRVTVALVLALDDLMAVYPVGLKVKVTSCRLLSPEERAAVPPSKLSDAMSRSLLP
jgi:hypothetical protein